MAADPLDAVRAIEVCIAKIGEARGALLDARDAMRVIAGTEAYSFMLKLHETATDLQSLRSQIDDQLTYTKLVKIGVKS